MVSASSAVQGHSEIAYGNAIGSIICNTALIAAITVAAKPSKIDSKALKMPVSFFFAAAVLYTAVAYISGFYSRLIGIILLAVFVIYVLLSVKEALGEENLQLSIGYGDIEAAEAGKDSVMKDLIPLVVGAALIAVGANLLIDNGTIIAKELGVPESVIALTFVALGTSLPELITAITSLLKGHGALSLGNVIGANLFNLVLVSGLSITLSPFALPSEKLIMGHNSSLVVDVPLMFFVMAFLTLPALKTGKLQRYQGIILLVLYFAFCIYQFAV